MSSGVETTRPLRIPRQAHSWLAAAGVLVVTVALIPPLATYAARYEWAEALQFAIFAVVGPALVVIGAPWRALHLAPSPFDRLESGRLRHRELARSLGFLALYLAVVVVWRTPAAVDAVSNRHWLVVVEASTLLIAGAGFWLELLESPPLIPRSPHPRRAVLAALSMWTIWAIAYMEAMSDASWYRGFRHVAATGLSASADRQLSTAILWAVTGAAFMPVIFWNLVQWLRDEEDPDDELYRLLRESRRRSTAL